MSKTLLAALALSLLLGAGCVPSTTPNQNSANNDSSPDQVVDDDRDSDDDDIQGINVGEPNGQSMDDDNDGDDDKDAMEDEKDDDNVKTPAPTPTPTTSSDAGTYTMAEVATHSSTQSCWSAINGSVYDLTTWITQHPGGEAAIQGLCGKDGSSAFNGQHGSFQQAQTTLAGFKIGTLK